MANSWVIFPFLITIPCTSSIVQIIFSFWSFEVSEDIMRNQNLILGLDSFYKQITFLVSIWFISVFVLTELLSNNIAVFSFGSFRQVYRVNDED